MEIKKDLGFQIELHFYIQFSCFQIEMRIEIHHWNKRVTRLIKNLRKYQATLRNDSELSREYP